MTIGIALGGGGLPGLAWTIGLLRAWEECGLAADRVERTVGTSAGAAAGALWHSPDGATAAFDRQVSDDQAPVEIHPGDGADFAAAVAEAAAHPVGSSGHVRAYLDRAPGIRDDGLRARSMRDRLAGAVWPTRDLGIVTLSHATEARRVFRATDGHSLADVVTASCAVPGVWPAVDLGGDLYSDAAVLSDAHADLLADVESVVVVEPTPNIGSRYRCEELTVLHRAVRVVPDDEATRVLGSDAFDAGVRPAAASAGYRQGRDVWRRIEALL